MMVHVRKRSDTLPAPGSQRDESDFAAEEPTQPAYVAIATEGAQRRERSRRPTEPMPLPRTPGRRGR